MDPRVDLTQALPLELQVLVASYLDVDSYLSFLYANLNTMLLLGSDVEAVRFAQEQIAPVLQTQPGTSLRRQDNAESSVVVAGNKVLEYLLSHSSIVAVNRHLSISNSQRLRERVMENMRLRREANLRYDSQSLFTYNLFLSRELRFKLIKKATPSRRESDEEEEQASRSVLVRLLSGAYRLTPTEENPTYAFLRLLYGVGGPTPVGSSVTNVPVQASTVTNPRLVSYVVNWFYIRQNERILTALWRDIKIDTAIQCLQCIQSPSESLASLLMEPASLLVNDISGIEKPFYAVSFWQYMSQTYQDFLPMLDVSREPDVRELLDKSYANPDLVQTLLMTKRKSYDRFFGFLINNTFAQFPVREVFGHEVFARYTSVSKMDQVYNRLVSLSYLDVAVKRKVMRSVLWQLLANLIVEDRIEMLVNLYYLGWIGNNFDLEHAEEVLASTSQPFVVQNRSSKVLVAYSIFFPSQSSFNTLVGLVADDVVFRFGSREPVRRSAIGIFANGQELSINVLIVWIRRFNQTVGLESFLQKIAQYVQSKDQSFSDIIVLWLWLAVVDYGAVTGAFVDGAISVVAAGKDQETIALVALQSVNRIAKTKFKQQFDLFIRDDRRKMRAYRLAEKEAEEGTTINATVAVLLDLARQAEEWYQANQPSTGFGDLLHDMFSEFFQFLKRRKDGSLLGNDGVTYGLEDLQRAEQEALDVFAERTRIGRIRDKGDDGGGGPSEM